MLHKDIRYLGRKQLLKKHVDYPDIMELKYTKHANERLRERTTGELILAPKWLRITRDNIYIGKLKGHRLTDVVVRIKYKEGVWMFLAIDPIDKVVKTIYFRNAEKNTFKERDERIEQIQENIEEACKNYGTETTGQGRLREDVGDVPGDMGREESWWKKLFRAIRKMVRI